MEKSRSKSLISPFNLFPRWVSTLSPFDEDFGENFFPTTTSKTTNLGLSEDERNVYVDVAIPGLKEKEIELTVDKGVLWVKGEHSEEEKDDKKTHYYKLNRSFSYRISIPVDIDEKAESTATYEDGVLHVVLQKVLEAQPKKITVKKAQ